ncbi:Hypothetical protein PHPALM_15129 [Phytophthora palmivora]|uniref:Uncharacterized protein n=1 Tax=Phytophthora palmivora TaxID=4796 RepID=A0A2P4XT01_9STRA|nr:Hypothetical protein PHPALM_15129 [Phytophthora palmivora]
MSVTFGLLFDGYSLLRYNLRHCKLQHILPAALAAEFGLTADSHINIIDTGLEPYHRDGTMVQFIVADN